MFIILKKPLFITIIVITLISGCKITGEYNKGNGFYNLNLTINKDSTFIYKTFNDVGGESIIKGRWTKKKNIITLNSFEKPSFKSNSAIDLIIPKLDKKIIYVQNIDVFANNSIISINNGQEIDTLKIITDTTHYYDEFPLFGTYTNIDSIKSIRILKTNGWTDCVLKDSTFYISNPTSNFIIIYTQPFNHYYGMNYLIDAEWKFKFNRIYIWRETKTKYSRKFYLRKK